MREGGSNGGGRGEEVEMGRGDGVCECEYYGCAVSACECAVEGGSGVTG